MPIDENTALDDRQRRERAYHEDFAARHRDKAEQPVNLDVISPGPRRPWNAFWTAYDLLMAEKPEGKRVLIPGCGFGEDAIRLASLGADVHASDLSPDLLDIARRRAERMGVANIHFDVMPAESLSYSDGFFDLVFFNDILHHVDIPAAIAETCRVLKPGARVVANELYTHSALQRVRESRLVSGFVYARMVRFIYGSDRPYITEDEHKINERELAVLETALAPGARYMFFLFAGGRLLPADWRSVQRFDRALLNTSETIGRHLAGRVVLAGTIRK
jgi:ubiquinone/menaquinone biosynthesis C-methylase UbiE